MNPADLDAMTAQWNRLGDYSADIIRSAQDQSYQLGLARGKEEIRAWLAQHAPLTLAAYDRKE